MPTGHPGTKLWPICSCGCGEAAKGVGAKFIRGHEAGWVDGQAAAVRLGRVGREEALAAAERIAGLRLRRRLSRALDPVVAGQEDHQRRVQAAQERVERLMNRMARQYWVGQKGLYGGTVATVTAFYPETRTVDLEIPRPPVVGLLGPLTVPCVPLAEFDCPHARDDA